MSLWRKTIVTRLAEDMALHIAVLVGTVGNVRRWQRQIGNRRKLLGEFVIGLLRSRFELGHGRLQLRDFVHQRLSARFVFGLLGVADFLRGRIAPRLRLLRRK